MRSDETSNKKAERLLNSCRPARAFTLVELLVVVAIIAVLVALLIPALGKAKDAAVRVQCASRLRGSGNLLAAYASDNNSLIPVASVVDTTVGSDQMAWWSWLIAQGFSNSYKTKPSYIDTAAALKQFTCPAQFPERFAIPNTASITAKSDYSYGMMYNSGTLSGVDVSSWMIRNPAPLNTQAAQRVNLVPTPSQIPQIADTVILNPGFLGDQWFFFYPTISASVAPYYGVHLRHNNAANVLYFDGHVDPVDYGAGHNIGLKCLVATDLSALP